jgi:WD40-like Beta Propeller Repeat
MKRCHLLSAALIVLGSGSVCFERVAARQTNRAAPPYASDKPLNDPALFAEGVISTGDYDSHPAFTPDGRTLYFLKSTPDFSFWTIVVSRFDAGRWGAPEVASFSGRYSDADPFITADGSRLYFISSRPVPGKTKPDMDIWMVEKTAGGWGEPKNLGAPVNSEGNEWYPTLTRDGTIYFGSDRAGGKGRTDIYRSRLVDGKYGEPENLGENINTQFNEFEPYISPDERFLIFMGGGRAEGLGGFDLYLSYRRQGAWTKPVNLGDKVNSEGNELSPMIAPGGEYLFWTSTRGAGFGGGRQEKHLTYRELEKRLRGPGNGLGDIYQIALSALNIEP